MKMENYTAATKYVNDLLTSYISDLVPVRVAKKDGFALETPIVDEDGKPIVVVINATAKKNKATMTCEAFDFEAAKQARADNEAEKAVAAKEKGVRTRKVDPEKEAKKNAILDAMKAWLDANLTSTPITSTDIKEAIPELEEITIMQVGTYMKSLAEVEANHIRRESIKGKTYYTRKEF